MKNYTDWENTPYFKAKGIPTSCCKEGVKCTPETLKDLDKAKTEVYTNVSLHPLLDILNYLVIFQMNVNMFWQQTG